MKIKKIVIITILSLLLLTACVQADTNETIVEENLYEPIQNMTAGQGATFIFGLGISGIIGSVIGSTEKKKRWKIILIYMLISLIIISFIMKDIIIISVTWLLNVIILLIETKRNITKENKE